MSRENVYQIFQKFTYYELFENVYPKRNPFTKHDLKQWYIFIILYFYCTSIFSILGVNLMGSSKNVDHPAINTNVRVFKKIKSQYGKKTKVPWIENRQTRTNALNLM